MQDLAIKNAINQKAKELDGLISDIRYIEHGYIKLAKLAYDGEDDGSILAKIKYELNLN